MAGKTSLRNWFVRRAIKSMLKDLFTLGFLKGRRTQVAAVAIAALTLLLNLGSITPEQYSVYIGFLTSVGLLTAAAHKPKE